MKYVFFLLFTFLPLCFFAQENQNVVDSIEVSGIIKDKDTKQPVSYATLVVYEKTDSMIEEIMRLETNQDAKYKLRLANHKQYRLVANSKDYFSQSIDIEIIKNNIVHDFELEVFRMTVKGCNGPIRLNTLYFDSNSINLSISSQKDLNKLIKILRENPTLSIEVGGHASLKERGTSDGQMPISLARAKVIKIYLVENGNINPDRIKVIGWEKRFPIYIPEKNPDEASENRRAEFRVIVVDFQNRD